MKKKSQQDRVYYNDLTGAEDVHPDTDLQHFDIDLKVVASPMIQAVFDEIRRVGGSRVLDCSDHGDGSYTIYVAPTGGIKVRRPVSFNLSTPMERVLTELSSYFIGIR